MLTFSFFKDRSGNEEFAGAVVTTAPSRLGELPTFSQEYEGELSVDVYQTSEHLVIKSTIAGVKPDDLEITLNNDVVTIRGKRYQETPVAADDYFYQECYWGGFSRSIVLPMEVNPEGIQANLKNGVLTVLLPKAPRSEKVVVTVAGEAV